MGARSRAFRYITAAALVVFGVIGTIGQASAHVSYGSSLFSDSSIIDPVTGVNGTGVTNATPNRTVSSNAGWLAGQNATTWANSHDNRFLYFNLAQASTINFTITGDNTNGNGALNPGYSIFQGVAPNLSHEGANYPGQTPFATWSPFATSPAGSSPTSQKWGEYRSNADFTMANDTAQVRTLTYTGLSGSNGSSNTLSGSYTLGPGVYSLIVGGANTQALATLFGAAQGTNGDYTNPSQALTDYTNARLARTFNIQFNVAPVPIPAAAWLFGSGIAGIAALARRRASR